MSGLFEVQGRSGLYVPKGSEENGSVYVQQAGSAYEAAVERGNVFVCAAQATVATQAGLSATTPAMTVVNRNNSGKEVILWYVRWDSLVSSSTAHQTWLAQGDIHATPVTETTPSTAIRNAKTGAIGAPSGIGIAIVATLPAAPIAVALLGGASSAAITVSIHNAGAERWFNGDRRLQPGGNWSVQTSTVGTIFTEFIIEVVDKK